ncbi:class I SAM-dependent methyltransferase [Mycobacterium sp. ML4]
MHLEEGHSRWNHNTHYYDIVLSSAPRGARTALDVGAGDGLLAALLSKQIADVVGVDSDASVIRRAKSDWPAVEWIAGDIMTTPLPVGHYDVVAAVATVHHLPDLGAALARLADLTAPGGSLVIIGCARNSTIGDYAADAVGAVQHQIFSRTRGYWQHTAPVQSNFPHTYSQVRQTAEHVLPGLAWRRLPLWRYGIIWKKPH